MTITTTTLANWGNYPVAEAEMAEPASPAEVREYLLSRERLIARGNGKCYGDAALSPHVLSTLALNRIVAFDRETGVVECEAGVLLADLLNIIVPAGWFFHVTPGIKFITVGGAIASDVHGKNHPAKGCFSNWLISFRLMTADGTILTCSRQENTTLFWQTCGGMGWTGIIVSAKFQLMKISSVQMRQKTVRANNLETLFRAFDEHHDWPYAVGWVDGTSGSGRGAVFLAEHGVGLTPGPSPVERGRGLKRSTLRPPSPVERGRGLKRSTLRLPSPVERGRGLKRSTLRPPSLVERGRG